MRSVRDLHTEAMALVDQARDARSIGDEATCKHLLTRALDLEREGALRLNADESGEPTRSILLNSAARIAIDLHRPRDAEKLVALALSGSPPDYLLSDLRDAFELANFSRHLEHLGLNLQEGHARMLMTGNSVAPGMAEKQEVFSRIDVFEVVANSELEREQGLSDGSAKPKRAFKTYLKFLEGSFVVDLRIGTGQLAFEGMDRISDVVSALFDQMEAFNQGDEDRLTRLIPDETYRKRFKEAARRLAPDGEEVSSVAFASMRGGTYREVILDRKRPPVESPKRRPAHKSAAQDFELVGVLLVADSAKQTERVRIVDDEGLSHTVHVPDEVMTVTIPLLYKKRVRAIVRGTLGRPLRYVDIEQSRD